MLKSFFFFMLPISLYVFALLLPELSCVIWGGGGEVNINITQFSDTFVSLSGHPSGLETRYLCAYLT